MTVTVAANSGPFVVTNPNTALILASGSTDVVTWDVANTTSAPVSCANVDILISTDGGANFSILVGNTPNDGSQTVTYPNVTSVECRIMVRSVGNVFYDVSDVNFILGNYQNYCNLIFASTDVPQTIPTDGTVTSTLTVPANGFVSDVDVINLIGTHTWISDLTMKLTSPSGLERIILDGVCDDENNFNINFNDEATNAYTSIPCPPIGGGTYKPKETFSPFDGSVSNDTWTLTITDNVTGDGGTLTSWGLKFCILSTTPLPVELISFSAKLVNETAHLDWVTASEHNNRGFHIERSVGHALDFHTIGWMPGHHSTNETNSYRFDDPDLKPGQLYYYRLRQESENGETDYSKVEVVSVGKDLELLHIYPNPAKSWLQIDLPKSLEATSMTVTVWDAQGRLVDEQKLRAGDPLDVSQQPQGVYWVKVVAEEAVLRGKYYVGW
jgi:subtilisin-like proprotein convertase family protein